MTVQQIMDEAALLPVEERAMLADSLLQSLNPPTTDTSREWIALAKQRLREVREGAVKVIPGDEVFRDVQKRFET